MPASSSSSHSSNSHMIPQIKYDVFLSFRGEDTRYNFTSHLYTALHEKNIETFIDDQLIRGDEISKSLYDTIEASRISVVIFSETYASSRWCLEELLKILECKNSYGQIVMPVFYRVDPSDVRHQSGTFGNSFSKLEDKFKGNIEKMQRWRNALRVVATFSGFHLHNNRPESELIKEVVNHILKRLAEMFLRNNRKHLIGVESRVHEISSMLLGPNSEDDYIIGIWGIGGIGKTAIARAVFHKISCNFEGSCFLENVREESQRPGGLACLQQKLLSSLLKDKNVVPDVDFNFTRLSCRKLLIVFDDVTCLNQIESLIGNLGGWFMPESRIIITTRNKQVLRNLGVKEIYEMEALENYHSLELFCRHAFKQNHPEVGYEELSCKVMKYAKGVPLALKVLGCFLFGRGTKVWESAVKKLTSILHPSVHEVLKVSYDGLDDKEKNIFLDVACFFKGQDVFLVTQFLDACGFDADIGISVLVDKSLIIISDEDQITMHKLLQEMGREIVRQEAVNNPGERSRLWHHKDIEEVLTYTTGTEKIEGICLDMSKIKEICLPANTFAKMCQLRFMKFYSFAGENKLKMSNFQGLTFGEQLRYLHWDGYPFKSLPPSIHPEKFIVLEMPRSNLEHLCDGVQLQGNLSKIVMAASKFFVATPKAMLNHDLNKLVILNLSECKTLKSIPARIKLQVLRRLDLSGCSNLRGLPDISSAGIIEWINLSGTSIEELPSSMEYLPRLTWLELRDCKRLKRVPIRLRKLKSLHWLFLGGCSNIQWLPDELANLEDLEYLKFKGAATREIFKFRGFEILSLVDPMISIPSIAFLNLSDCSITELPESLGMLPALVGLYLEGNNIERIPESIIKLSRLKYLYLSYCQRLRALPKLPRNLNELLAHHCKALESVSDLLFFSSQCESGPKFVDLNNNFKLDWNEIRGILEGGLQNIQALAGVPFRVRRNMLCSVIRGDFDGCLFLPGSEIPMWFSFQSIGSHITLKLPPVSFRNNKILGFAFGTILEFGEHHVNDQKLYLCCELKLKCEDRELRVVRRFKTGVYCAQSDHLLLGYSYFKPHHFIDCIPEAVDFYFVKSCRPSERLECCTVKKCGISFFHPFHSTNLIEEPRRRLSRNEEEEPDLKKLRYLER